MRWCMGLLVMLPGVALAWGQTGHRVVGELAERHVDRATLLELRRLLPEAGLAEVSTWADDIRSNPRWSCGTPLHYVTVARETSWGGPPAEGDAVVAVVAFGDVLADPTRPDEDRANAVRWLVHLLGDLHQPLHAGFGCDRGANNVWVSWFGERSNLHKVWDEEVIDDELLSFSDKTRFLDDATASEVAGWQAVGPLGWVDGAQSLQPVVYQTDPSKECTCVPCVELSGAPPACAAEACASFLSEPPALSYPYRDAAQEVIDAQLRRGGARLAALLDALILTNAWPADWKEEVAYVRSVRGWDEAPTACLRGP